MKIIYVVVKSNCFLIASFCVQYYYYYFFTVVSVSHFTIINSINKKNRILMQPNFIHEQGGGLTTNGVRFKQIKASFFSTNRSKIVFMS